MTLSAETQQLLYSYFFVRLEFSPVRSPRQSMRWRSSRASEANGLLRKAGILPPNEAQKQALDLTLMAPVFAVSSNTGDDLEVVSQKQKEAS